MKRFTSFLVIAGLAVGFMAWSCGQDPVTEPDEQNQEENGNTEEPTGPQPGAYKFVASPLKGTWQAGDQIYVHGNLGTEAKVYTLTSSDLSDGGKTATIQLDKEVTNSPYDPNGLYAAWPAEAVKLFKGILKTKTTFLDCDRLLTISYLEGDTFNFMDVSSMLNFTVSGDYDQYAISANNFDGLTFTSFEVEHSSDKTKYTTKNNGDPFKTGSMQSGKPVSIYMPGQYSFKTGLTIYVGKNGEWPLAYVLDQKLTLKPGETTDLGDITASLKPYQGPGPKVPVMGERTKFKVKFNELSGLCVSADGDFLWTVGDNGELAQIGLDGTLLNRVVLKWGEPKGSNGGYDTEGITVNPETGDLLVSMEQNYVGEITLADHSTAFQVDTAWNIVNTIFRIKEAENYGNSGTEGISYYKDGLVYVGAQDGPADLFLCEIATGKVVDRKTLGKIFPSMSEIAGLSYDPLTDWLWVVDSNSPQKIFALSGDATRVYAVYSLEDTDNPESICVDHKHSCIWVGDDAGSTSYVYKYEFTGLDDYNLK